MKSFLTNLARYLFFIIGLLIITHTTTPFDWGNEGIAVKRAYLDEKGRDSKNNQYNTFFLGSSRTYRHIIPSLFDSIIGHTKSYNFGINGLSSHESYWILENLFKGSYFKKDDVIFLELQAFKGIPDKNLHSVRTKYFLNLENLIFAIRVLLNEEHQGIGNHLISYCENVLRIGMVKAYVDHIFLNNISAKKRHYLGPKGDGFYSLDENLIHKGKGYKSLQQRNTNFKQDFRVLKSRKKSISNYFKKASSSTSFNQAHLNKILQLIDLGNKQGVKIIFFYPPRLEDDIVELYDSIPLPNKIELANPNKYPEFYSLDNSFDVGHLNRRGAEVFTEALTKKVNEIKVYSLE